MASTKIIRIAFQNFAKVMRAHLYIDLDLASPRKDLAGLDHLYVSFAGG